MTISSPSTAASMACWIVGYWLGTWSWSALAEPAQMARARAAGVNLGSEMGMAWAPWFGPR
ncbi:MAG: hypothetical protein KDA31_14910 [Phycisphaerales bacterium]|nr:hypothetical protein [Phycisphaerales bacterium]